ncbi:hypothetical protein VKT23_018497 [Stygiomarasmius scandens]|uniref:DUF551 domain-containing protein n=1 Tax=Marasmiellus scandens TaxID=2682957 RepID=A0ABR1IRE1_9AGAR
MTDSMKKPEPYDFGAPPEAEEFVDSISNHTWKDGKVFFTVNWSLGDITNESYGTVKNLRALDDYFQLVGVSRWQDLPKTRQSRKTKR